MTVPLGRREPPADLVALLLECHGRIRSFLDLARLVATRPDLGPADVADGAQRVERYFAQALPLHVRDEEESLLPRLRGREPALDRALEAMRAQHAEHAPQVAALLAALAALRAAPGDEGLRAALGPIVERLAGELAAHLEAEEDRVVPAIRRLLDAAAQAEVVRELRARRRPAPGG